MNHHSGWNGGAEENRTPDLLIANETLYQLSYSPARESPADAIAMFGQAGMEDEIDLSRKAKSKRSPARLTAFGAIAMLGGL